LFTQPLVQGLGEGNEWCDWNRNQQFDAARDVAVVQKPASLNDTFSVRLAEGAQTFVRNSCVVRIGSFVCIHLRGIRRELQSNELSGTLPKQLSALTNLETFKCNANMLVGDVPNITSANLTLWYATFSLNADY
jgi:hypothetical protein